MKAFRAVTGRRRRATQAVSAAFAAAAFAVLCAASPSRAEGTPLADYLITARRDAMVEARKGGAGPASGTYMGLPFIKDMEVRVRNEAWDPGYMRYTLRLKPRGIGEGGAARALNRAEIERSRQRDLLLLDRAVLTRYLLAVDCLMYTALHRNNEELITVLEDKIRVLEKLKSTEDFDLADLIDEESDLTKLKSQDLEMQKELGGLQQQIELQLARAKAGGGDSAGFAYFDTTGLVSPDSIIAEVEKGTYVLDTNHVYLRYLKQNLALAESRYRLEKAKGREYLSFLSFGFDMGERNDELERRSEDKDYDLNKAYSVEVGFRLPFLTEGSLDLNHRKEDLLSEREDYAERRQELEDVMRKDLKDIGSLVVQYRYLRNRENEVDGQASLKKYMRMSGVDPMALLNIKEANLKNRLKLEEVRYGIIRNWIKVLDAAGHLSTEPLRNHLAAGSPELKP